MNTILSNAVLSIALAVDDFRSDDQHRAISGMRNITAGILLLFKHRLLELSPKDSNEVLIKSRIEPRMVNGNLTFVGKGKTTVDKQEILERFKALDIVADWTRTDELIRMRNDIEHYRTDAEAPVMREAMAKAFVVINKFCNDELKQKPIDLFGQAVWDVFLEQAEIVDGLLDSIRKSNEAIRWKHAEMAEVACNFECTICGSAMLRVKDPSADVEDLVYHCENCGSEDEFYKLINEALVHGFGGERYRSFKDSGEHFTEDCDSCGRDSYITSRGYCVVCGHTPFVICTTCKSEYHYAHYCERCDYGDGMEDGPTPV